MGVYYELRLITKVKNNSKHYWNGRYQPRYKLFQVNNVNELLYKYSLFKHHRKFNWEGRGKYFCFPAPWILKTEYILSYLLFENGNRDGRLNTNVFFRGNYLLSRVTKRILFPLLYLYLCYLQQQEMIEQERLEKAENTR